MAAEASASHSGKFLTNSLEIAQAGFASSCTLKDWMRARAEEESAASNGVFSQLSFEIAHAVFASCWAVQYGAFSRARLISIFV